MSVSPAGRKAAGLLCLLSAAMPLAAAESGSGLFVPGSSGFGAGAVPPPGVYATQAVMFYDGKAGATVDGGTISLDARKTAVPLIMNLTYVPKSDLLGGRVGLSASVPYLSYTRIRAEVVGYGRTVTDGWGMGDISLKTALGWSPSSHFSHNVAVTFWLPTGRYDTGFAPNAGKRHFGVHLGWAFTQIWDSGLELSGATGISFEDSNSRTHYRNGTGWNLDGAIGMPVGGGVKIGVAGFALKQLGADSGAGATLGAFKGQAFGIGPAVNFGFKLGDMPVSASFRHYQEFAVENRFNGHISTISFTTPL